MEYLLSNNNLNNKEISIPLEISLNKYIYKTQPQSLLNHDYLGGINYSDHKWFKIFRINKGIKSLYFSNYIFDNVNNKKKIKKNVYSIKCYLPNGIIIIKNFENTKSNSPLGISVLATNDVIITPNSKLYNYPIPNLFDDGRLCQSNKISISKHYSNINYNLLTDNFTISKYYIDMLWNSVFNTDLDNKWIDVLKSYGFKNIYEFFNCVNNEKMLKKYKEICINTEIPSYINTLKNILDFDNYSSDDNIFFENMFSYQKSCINNLSKIKLNIEGDFLYIGDNIKYENEDVKIISFGPNIYDDNILVSNLYEDYHHIICMKKDKEIINIPFSKILDMKIEISYENVEIDDIFLCEQHKNISTYEKITEIKKVLNMNKYVISIKNNTLIYNKYFLKNNIVDIVDINFIITKLCDQFNITKTSICNIESQEKIYAIPIKYYKSIPNVTLEFYLKKYLTYFVIDENYDSIIKIKIFNKNTPLYHHNIYRETHQIRNFLYKLIDTPNKKQTYNELFMYGIINNSYQHISFDEDISFIKNSNQLEIYANCDFDKLHYQIDNSIEILNTINKWNESKKIKGLFYQSHEYKIKEISYNNIYAFPFFGSSIPYMEKVKIDEVVMINNKLFIRFKILDTGNYELINFSHIMYFFNDKLWYKLLYDNTVVNNYIGTVVKFKPHNIGKHTYGFYKGNYKILAIGKDIDDNYMFLMSNNVWITFDWQINSCFDTLFEEMPNLSKLCTKFKVDENINYSNIPSNLLFDIHNVEELIYCNQCNKLLV